MNSYLRQSPRLKHNELFKNLPIFHTKIEHTIPYDKRHLYSHDTPELTLVLSGSGIHRIQDMDVPCQAGDIYVVNADTPHGYFSSDAKAPLTVRHLLFDASAFMTDESAACRGVFRESEVAAYAMLNEKTFGEVSRLLDTMLEELDEKRENYKQCITAYLDLLLISVGRYINNAMKNIPTSRGKDWEIISAATRMIADRITSGVTLEEISKSLFVSTGRLSRLFDKLTGRSFSEYLRSVRMAKACLLLTESDMTVGDIMESCGLHDANSFYKAFYHHTGMTPNNYRTNEKNIKAEESKGKKFMVILSEISANLQAGKAKLVREMVATAISEGIPAENILRDGLLSAMTIVGEKFKNNEIYVPEVLVAARAMNQGVELLKPLLIAEGVEPAGKIVIGTVHGDLHDIGKNIVKMMLEGKGFEVIDLGTDVPAKTFVDSAINNNCQIICCSALLTTTMNVMADVVRELDAAGVRGKIKLLVGGAPVTEEFANSIGADGYSVDAASCADLALKMVKEEK